RTARRPSLGRAQLLLPAEPPAACSSSLDRIQGPWLIRRLAPDCSRIEIASLRRVREEVELLQAMGWETGNIHLRSGERNLLRILADLRRRHDGWLLDAAKAMVESVFDDWKRWRK